MAGLVVASQHHAADEHSCDGGTNRDQDAEVADQVVGVPVRV